MTTGSSDTSKSVEMNSGNDDVAVADVGAHTSRVDSDVFNVLFGGESEEWPDQVTKKGFRASWPITILVALLLALGGLTLGSFLQRQQPSSSTTTSPFNRAGAAAFGGTASAGATTGATSTASTTTTGTVTDIVGNTLYVTNSSGALVAVKVNSSTTIDRNAASTLSGLKPGDTVTVQGSSEKNGSFDAASVSDTAKGVTPAGFGGGFAGRFGGGTGTSSTGATSGG